MEEQKKAKRVWVTGASAGIGRSVALAFAREGAALLLLARRKEELEKVCATCLQAGATSCYSLVLDLEKGEEEIEKVAREGMAIMKGVDVLVNNGGLSQRGPALETGMEVYRRLMEVNFFGTIALTRALLPEMVREKSGQIVVISSIAGKVGTPMRTGYAAAKHALHGYFDSLRMEVTDYGISVLMVCPGYIHTDVSVNALGSNGEATGKMDENQQKGLPPSAVATAILNGIKAGKQEIAVGGRETLVLKVKRFFPGLVNKLVMKNANLGN